MKEGAGGEREDPQECDKGAGGGSEDLQGRDKGAGGHRCFGADWGQCQEFQPVVGNLTTKWVDLCCCYGIYLYLEQRFRQNTIMVTSLKPPE